MTKTNKAAVPETSAETSVQAATAQPDPNQPTSNPPGGGRWTWSAANQAWQTLPEPASDAA